MFEWLATAFFVILLLVWILDGLGVLDIFAALFELIGAVVAAILRLAAWLVRRIAAPAADESRATPPSPQCQPREYSGRWRGSRKPPTD